MPAWNEVLKEFQDSASQRHGSPDSDGIRRKYLAELYNLTGRNVILYSTRFTIQGPDIPPSLLSIVDEDMNGIMTVVHKLRGKKLDLIIHSPGGSLEAAEAIVEYLRSKFSDIRVIVPQLALSAATMVACSADKVVLGKHSFLGPIDPQILIRSPLGGQMTYVPAQAIKDQFDKAVVECRDPKKLPAWVPMLQQYGPHLLVACDDAASLAETLVMNWLTRWMFKGDADKDKKAQRLATWLASHKEWKSHGRHIPRWQLQRKGMRIEQLEKSRKFQNAVLSVFHATTHTFSFMPPVAKIIENHLGSAFVKLAQMQQMPLLIPGQVVPAPARQPPATP
jgi:hypothetical protein